MLYGLRPSTFSSPSPRTTYSLASPLMVAGGTAARAMIMHATPCAGLIEAPPSPFVTSQRQQLMSLSMQHSSSVAAREFAAVTRHSHAGFAACELPELPEDGDQLPSSAWIESIEPPSRTSEGDLTRFPWLQQHRGQIYSVKSQRTAHPLDRLVNLGLDSASVDGKRGSTHTGVRAFHAFCRDEFGTTPHRPMDVSAPLWAKLQEELLAMRFVCALIEVRGITVRSAAAYWSATQGWHAREHGVKIGGGLKFERLPQMLKGLRRALGDPERAVRRGVAPQALRKAMDLCLDPEDPNDANIRAALAVALQGLLRSSEYAVDPGKVFDCNRMVTRGDIVELTVERMTLMMAPCKNMHHLSGKTCALVIGAGGEFIDAVAEVRNMLRVDPLLPGQDPKSVPLFRRAGSTEPLRTNFMRDVVRRLMRSVGENPAQFGTHSLRIGGATALFAAGADETVIRTMGRWSSDIHQLYVRACFERCCEWSRRAGSTTVTDVARVIDEVDFY